MGGAGHVRCKSGRSRSCEVHEMGGASHIRAHFTSKYMIKHKPGERTIEFWFLIVMFA